MKDNIPTAEFLNQLSKEGMESYKQDVLNGPVFKKIINQIEDAALDGYKGWRRPLDSRTDEMRALKVIREELQSRGFYCEFETVQKNGLLGEYKVKIFVVKWGEKEGDCESSH
ncbi:hypothetical protein [Lysinibacillus odysseyi]|uniref:Uncharacterized protein n=1 Tax=Lysinibacillus odysseyi 34hs-1 = NBRC 100172 TaxID=1220589 RepID=A0A0A3J2F4_9BACI|nr:hypothetical protein [Lysinibacillus odysseyi]KGR89338.1 hypothetical protein CD32_00415 [Lysinibacillus odysseyi 34hs-1 = NBRC 100172]